MKAAPTVTHRCRWCDADYACDTFVSGEDEHGHERSTCDCRETDTCPQCSELPPLLSDDEVGE